MNKKIIFIVFLLLVSTLSLLLYLHRPFSDHSPKLRLVFFDVGQGDSALITTPAGQTILVDGGEGDRVLSKLGKYLPFYQKKINYMILTHPHADHLDGLVPVLKKYQIEQIFYSGVTHTTDAFLKWLGLIKEKNIPLKIIDHQQTLALDNGVRLEFLYPDRVILNEAERSEESLTSSPSRTPDEIRDDEAISSAVEGNGIASSLSRQGGTPPRNDMENNNLNNTSVVFRLTYGKNSFLFMGDAETPVEEELLACHSRPVSRYGVNSSGNPVKSGMTDEDCGLRAEVLKIAHHGSHSSTSEEFLQAVQPQIAVISVGQGNDFGHPHLRTLRRLERFGAKILRTDEVGEVEIASDGIKIWQK